MKDIETLHSMRALAMSWWLLALCGVLDAMHSAMNLFLRNPNGSLALRRLAPPNTVLIGPTHKS